MKSSILQQAAEDILVIVCDGRVSNLLNALNQKQQVAVDLKEQDSKGMVRVCSLNAATGLESYIVFVMGVGALLEAEESLSLSEEDRYNLVRDNTRKLYMAFTRASWRLGIVSSKKECFNVHP